MANTLSPKSQIIRHAVASHPAKGNTEMAAMLNDSADRLDDKLTFTPQEVANQKTALKKPGAMRAALAGGAPPAVTQTGAAADPAAEPAHEPEAAKPEPKKRGRKPGVKNKPRTIAPGAVSPVDLIDRVFGLAEQCGGMGELRRLVERLAAR
ncbi:MAG: hypothetical protein ACRC33_04025 [Gemmataceae bacterium]